MRLVQFTVQALTHLVALSGYLWVAGHPQPSLALEFTEPLYTSAFTLGIVPRPPSSSIICDHSDHNDDHAEYRQ